MIALLTRKISIRCSNAARTFTTRVSRGRIARASWTNIPRNIKKGEEKLKKT